MACFITTMPPAQLARRAASAGVAPAARARVKVAITVSPAPVTSATSSVPWMGMWSGARPGSKSAMPSLPRVTSTALQPSFSRSVRPAASSRRRSWPMVTPRASSTSGSFGVTAVMPRKRRSAKRESTVTGIRRFRAKATAARTSAASRSPQP